MPSHLRIFLASPGDVADERGLALKVLEELPYTPFLKSKVTLEIVAWDKAGAGTPMLATLSPQEAIAQGLAKPSQCHIVIAIFWSRMGTLLPQDWIKPPELRYLAGSEFESWDARYLSGTEWEYFDALQAAEANDTPKLLVYRRTEKQTLDQEDPKFDEKRRQWKLVNAFFGAFRNPDGSLRGGYNEYPTPAQFAKDLRHHLQGLIKTLLETPVAPTPPPTTPTPASAPPYWPGSPFPGLRAFTDQDAPIYFGRDTEIDGLIGKLASPDNRFIAVVGASGSGKSSLVWAGLLPRLLGQTVDATKPRIGALPGSQDWIWTRFTPGEVGDNPFMALATSLKKTLEKHGEAPRAVAAELYKDPSVLSTWVQRVLAGKPEWGELVLFIDQFEELFTLVSADYQRAFVDLLARAITLHKVRTIVTMRADFYHRCLEEPVLRGRFENQQWEKSHFPLLAPGMGQLYEMITRPAERAGLALETGLVERILDDTGTEPGALALMAFALAALYEAKTPDGQLTHRAYDSFSGVAGAIGQRADDTFKKLAPSVQAKLGDVFRDLVEVDERTVATRRRALLPQLTASREAQTLVNAFTDARLLVTSQGGDNESIVEVAHEALFRNWPRLRQWIEITADDLRLRRQITQLATYWQEHGCDDRHRWSDERVEEAVNMVNYLGLRPEDFSDQERTFLGPLDRQRMLEEIHDPATSHEQRAIIGVRLSLLGDTRAGVGLREDGLPDLVWCQVPGGEIALEIEEMQQSRLARWLRRSALNTFQVEPFYIAKYPLTYIQYQAFLEADDGFHNPAWWQDLWFQVNEPGKQFNKRENHPAENLCWLEAVAFCRWLSAKLGYQIRLPSEWEWQQAATGGDPAYVYPWGPEWDNTRANTFDSDLSRSTAVGMYPAGASPVGALDMAGNVFEWCLNEYYKPSSTHLSGDASRVRRGGAWIGGPDFARAAFRSWFTANDRLHNVGLRLACVAPIL